MMQFHSHFQCLAKDLGLKVDIRYKKYQNFDQFFKAKGLLTLARNKWDFIVINFGAHYNMDGLREANGPPVKCFKPTDYSSHLEKFIQFVKQKVKNKAKLLWLESPTQHFPNGYYTIPGKKSLIKDGMCS